MDKIYELLGVEKLDESKQDELKVFLDEMVDLKAKDRAKELTKEITEPVIEQAKSELVSEYEEKFAEYKDGVVTKFSNFLDKVLDEELEIPSHIQEFARKGELYEDLIEQFKVRLAIDEGILDEEARGLLREAREEITSLREEKDALIGENMELEDDAKAMASHIKLRQKCDGMTEAQRNTVMNMLEDETDFTSIEKKFDVIVENMELLSEEKKEEKKEEEDVKGDGKEEVEESDEKKEEKEEKKDDKEEKVEETACVCPECGKETSISEGKCSLNECPDCKGVKLTEKKIVKEDVDAADVEIIEEDASPFKNYMNQWQNVLKTNKF